MLNDLVFTNGSLLQPGTLYCVGRNYAKHAREMGAELSESPVIFIKPPAAYIPGGSNIILPDFSKNVHHELELVVVIGQDAVSVDRSQAGRYIAGYAVGIDVTLRDIQNQAKAKGEPWAVSKGFHTSAPISQIVPASELTPDPFFDLELYIDGELKQSGNTSVMEYSVPVLVEYLSKVFTLNKGDCIFTGTPEGVGQIRKGNVLKASLKGLIELEVGVE